MRKFFIIKSENNGCSLVPVGSISFPSEKYTINAENKFEYKCKYDVININIIQQLKKSSSNILTVIFGSLRENGGYGIICEVVIKDTVKFAALDNAVIDAYINNALCFGKELDIHNIMVPEWNIQYNNKDDTDELKAYRDHAFKVVYNDIFNYLIESKAKLQEK